MKKYMFIALIILLFLVSCTNKNVEEQEDEVYSYLDNTLTNYSDIEYQRVKNIYYNETLNSHIVNVRKGINNAIVESTFTSTESTMSKTIYFYQDKVYDTSEGKKTTTLSNTLTELDALNHHLNVTNLKLLNKQSDKIEENGILTYSMNLENVNFEDYFLSTQPLPYTTGDIEILLNTSSPNEYFSYLKVSLIYIEEGLTFKLEYIFNITSYNANKEVMISSQIIDLM